MTEPRRIASLSDLKEGEITGIKVDGEELALYLVEGTVYVTSDVCPHTGCLLSEAGVIEGEDVECSCHGSRFRLRSGANVAPPAASRLQTFRPKVEGDDILINWG